MVHGDLQVSTELVSSDVAKSPGKARNTTVGI